MRIAHIALPTSPFSFFGKEKVGGGQVTLFNILHYLPNDYEIDLYTYQQDQIPDNRSLPSNLNIIDVSQNRQKPTNETTLTDRDRITDIITKKEYDLIHSNYWVSGSIAMEIKKRTGTPFIQSFWTLEKIKNHYLPDYQINTDRVWWEQKIITETNVIIANTHLEQQDLQTFYQTEIDKIKVIPPGICDKTFRNIERKTAQQELGLDPHFRYLLFVGRMDPIKGLPLLIDAMCKVKKTIPNSKLIITGGSKNNDYFKYIDTDIRSCKLQDIVILKEAQPHDKLPYYYNAADATIVPSYHETFGLVALESLASQTPVVASKVGGLTTFIEHEKNGLLVPPHDQDALSDAMIRILSDDELRFRMKKNAYTTSTQYLWSNLIKKYIALYQAFGEK